MTRFDQVASWVIVGVFAAVALIAAAGVGLWWFGFPPTAPSCGDVAVAQLNAAIDDLRTRIPSLRFEGTGDDCDSGGGVYAFWETHDLGQLLSDAAAAGCRVHETDPTDPAHKLWTCPTSGRDAVITAGLGTVPLEGEMTLS
jgi:hypothetical protein